MAFTSTTDVLLHVFRTSQLTAVGQKSIYASEPHPGTGNKIEGWKWDQRTWPSEAEFSVSGIVPSIWDPQVSGVDNDLIQSGFGDNNDVLLLDVLEVQVSGEERWAPKINHGFFYSKQTEWFLYSDWHQTEHFTLDNVASNRQFVDLTYKLKPTIPVTVRQYLLDRTTGRNNISLDFRKVVDFTATGEDPNFVVDNSFTPPRVILDDSYNTAIGEHVTVSGQLLTLENIGLSDGTANQQFSTNFCPVDSSQVVEVWTWNNPSEFPDGIGLTTHWGVVSGLDIISSGQVNEVKVDYDLGTIQFGNFDVASGIGNGAIPTQGVNVGIHYTKGVQVQYEPESTRDYVTAYSNIADVNPINSSTHRGFVQIGVDKIEPESITLTANLPQVNPFLIELGNNVGELTATVRGTGGGLIEGEQVTFEILAPKIGTFGATAQTVSAITGSDGKAKVFYNSPSTIIGIGKPTINIVHNGSDSVVNVVGITDPGDVQKVFIYRIEKADEVLGFPVSGLSLYYSDYLSDEGIVEDPDGTTSTQDFEEDFRAAAGLETPLTYPTSDIDTGKKTLIVTTKPAAKNVIDPDTGDIDINDSVVDVISALLPDTTTNAGTTAAPILQLVYNGVNLELPGTGTTKSYFVVSETQTSIDAFVVNDKTNETIRSNEIEMRVTIPDTANGTFFCTDLSALSSTLKDKLFQRVRNIDDISDADIIATSGIDSFFEAYNEERFFLDVTTTGIEAYVDWFRRTRRGDTQGLIAAQAAVGGTLAPESIDLINCGEIPLGFRLKSTGISLGSILDQITFLDPNDRLPNTYFDVESNVSMIGHEFEVGSIV